MKTLLLSPDCSITEHSIPEFIYNESVYNSNDVVVLRCNGILDNACLTFDAKSISKNDKKLRNITCMQCRVKRKVFEKNSKFKSYNLDDLLGTNEFYKIKSKIDLLSKIELPDFKFKDISIGKYCFYEIILNNKKNNLQINDDEILYFKSKVLNSCVILIAIEAILSKYNFSSFYTYNPLYSHNRCASIFLNRKGIRIYGMHACNNFSVRLKRLSIFESDQTKQELNIINNWSKHKDNITLNKKMVDQIYDHLMVMIYSRFWGQYGTKYTSVDIRKKFNINKNKKIYLATLSSADERFAAETIGVSYFKDKCEIFNNQYEWVKFLINFLSENEDIHLIIRIHPRDYHNLRYPGNSQNAENLIELLSNLPSNITFNTPKHNISIFDLAHQVSLLLNYHSSAGREFSLLGIPVLIHSESVHTFTTDFCIKAKDITDYKKLLLEPFVNDSAKYSIICSLKWFAFEHFYNTVELKLPKYFYRSELSHNNIFLKILIKLKYVLPDIFLNFELKYFKYLNKNIKYKSSFNVKSGLYDYSTVNNKNDFKYYQYFVKKLKNSNFVNSYYNSELYKSINSL